MLNYLDIYEPSNLLKCHSVKAILLVSYIIQYRLFRTFDFSKRRNLFTLPKQARYQLRHTSKYLINKEIISNFNTIVKTKIDGGRFEPTVRFVL